MDAKEKILAAADQLFATIGCDAASTREISEASGVSKALIHYHFKNKDEVLHELLERYYARLLPTLMGALTHGNTVRERWGHVIETYVDFMAANRNFAVIAQRETAGGQHVEMTGQNMRRVLEGMSIGVNQMLGGGEDTHELAVNLTMSAYGMIYSWFSFGHVIGPVLGSDPFAPEVVAVRKAHLRQIMSAVLSDIGVDLDGPLP